MFQLGANKTCSNCKISQPIINFKLDRKYKDNIFCWCKECCKEYRKKDYIINKDLQRKQSTAWKEKNKDRRNAAARVRENKKYKEDICFKLKKNLRTRINSAIKNKQKSGSAIKDLGCTIEELKLYIGAKFQIGMNWSNHGFGPDKWHIDHIIPLARFDLADREQFLKACHYTNLQPLWHTDNLIKGKKEYLESIQL